MHFSFSDCIEIASEAGIQGVIQPGGSIKDDLSIESVTKEEYQCICLAQDISIISYSITYYFLLCICKPIKIFRMGFFDYFNNDLAIDLGTANTHN